MHWKILAVMVFGISLIFSGQALAAGPGSKGGGQKRMMTSGTGSKAQVRNMQTERVQVRERSRSHQAALPEQASDTARAGVGSAGMGNATAEAVGGAGIREHAATPARETGETAVF